MALFVFIAEGLSVPVNAELFTRKLGWTAEHYGHAQGIYGTAGKLLGALLGGFLADRFGARRIAGIGMFVTMSACLAFAMTSTMWTNAGYPLVAFFLLLETGLALTSVSLFAFFMKISWTTAAATQFTMYMTILNIGFAGGPLLTRLGLDYTDTYLLCAALAIVPVVFLPLLNPASVDRRKLQQPPESTQN